MKATSTASLAAGSLLLVSALQSLAIEGLQISLQCPDVILGWPSSAGETYIVQWRPDLNPATPWATLTNSLPADSNTNWTAFGHSNRVQCAAGGTNSSSGGGGEPPPLPQGASLAAPPALVSEPMVKPADGSGSAVPLCIYPPGFDLSGFIIFDPSTGEWVSGAGYTVSFPTLTGPQRDDPEPQDDPPPGDPDPAGGGFYQVARIGIHVVGLSNLTSTVAADTISIPFEAANAVGTLCDLTVLVDGTRYRGVTPQIAPDIGGPLLVDTSFLENGDHYFQIEGNWLNPDTSDPNNAYLQQFSDSFTLSVSNFIYYPEWEDEISELGFCAYFATTTCTNSDWRIDIYDVGSNYVQSLTGYTTNGVIEAYWNMVDTNGVARTNGYLDPVFDSIITVSGSGSKKPPQQAVPLPYPDHGGWAIAYQDAFYGFANSNQYYNAIYMMGSLGANFGGAYTYWPVPGHPEYGQTFPLRYDLTNHHVDISYMIKDANTLELLLSNNICRNFYYNGHATANSIAGYLNANWLQFGVLRNKTNNLRHYYRFAFIDGCESANGSLPAALGINFNSPQPLDYFQKHGIRPRAFVGYNIEVKWCYRGPAPGSIPEEVCYFLTNFEYRWYYGEDLFWSIYYAVRDTPYIDWDWATGQTLKVYGYDGLHVDEYNHKSDWSN